jgi:molecular chaperone GrpE
MPAIALMETTDQNANRQLNSEQAEIARLKEELRREQESYLRVLADFDNYRRRTERERASAGRSGKREIILALLDLLDGYDRALQHMENAPASIAEGLEALHRKFLGLLQAQGVTAMVTVGEIFDPQIHDAIGLVKSDEVPSGTVAEEMQRGYWWGDEVLRPARVRVAQ